MSNVIDLDAIKAKYEKLYTVDVTLELDDDTTEKRSYLFRKPTMASSDRVVKTSANSPTKATRAFVIDNIVPEQLDALATDIEEYPAIAMSLTDKLFALLGLSKDISVKKL